MLLLLVLVMLLLLLRSSTVKDFDAWSKSSACNHWV
jgi:hypothetical protein